MHGHANMEIMTYVLSGSLEHKDSLGNGSVIRPGDIQLMSAGKGILHSEFNPSKETDVHLLQIWIMPSERGTRPGYQQTTFDPAEMQNNLRLVVSPNGTDGSLTILQDARVYAARLDAGKSVDFTPQSDRKYWLQIAKGRVHAGQALAAGDALALENHTVKVDIRAEEASEILLFDLPL